jgi:hypothetical protein
MPSILPFDNDKHRQDKNDPFLVAACLVRPESA